MTCREFVEFLMDYLEGTLPAASRATFERHVADCPDCKAYLATYRETVRLGKAVYRDLDADVPADVPEDLVRAILDARRQGH
jgi:anti-sigma factor RsiW